jgi:hypothetical protein
MITRNDIAAVTAGSDETWDNVAIALASYFSDHLDRPEDDEEGEDRMGDRRHHADAIAKFEAAHEFADEPQRREATRAVHRACVGWWRDKSLVAANETMEKGAQG